MVLGENRKFVEEDRTFFCSELVAKAFKSLKVFDTQLPSSSFLPSSMAEDNLPLAAGASLSKTSIIIIN
jgi:hypothetical protein